MSGRFPDLKTVIAKVITNKPVRKTPYQVKGVFMKHYPDADIIPMLDGTYRNKFLYPRVQVKILNEQIYLLGIHEGVDPVLSLCKNIKSLNFGNITIDIENCEIENLDQQLQPSSRLIRYRFITPWIALNHMTGGKYKKLGKKEKSFYLNKLIGQNIIFLANEVGINLEDDIFTKVNVDTLYPKSVDENKWGSFTGEFNANFILPNYIGIGNGITRGFGTVYGMFDPETFSSDEEELNDDAKNSNSEDLKSRTDLQSISASDVPKPKRKNRSKRKKQKTNSNYKSKKPANRNRKKKYTSGDSQNKSFQKHQSHKKRKRHHGHVFSEDYTIEDDKQNNDYNSEHDNKDDQRFNTEKHHKKQHKF